jgi:hypothetical protein
MGRDLHDVIGGVGVGLGKISGYNFVDALAASRVHQFAERGAAGSKLMSQAQHRPGDGPGLGASEAYHANASAPGRGGNGDDGIVEVHRIVLSLGSQFSV